MDVQKAALCLWEMKQAELDAKTAMHLRNVIRKTERRFFFETHSIPPKQTFPSSSQHLSLKINRQNVENNIQNDYKIEKSSRNEKGVFAADPAFVQKLNRGEINLTRLPPLGKAIDGITLPRLPPIESLQGQISNCSAPFEKQLTMSDVNAVQTRFAIGGESVKCILKSYMGEKEYAKVVDKSHNGLKVTVYGKTGRGHEMKFVKWGKMHALTGGWNAFSSENQFEIHLDWATVWMFRHKETHKLCFGIVARRFPTSDLIGKTQKNGNKNKKQDLLVISK